MTRRHRATPLAMVTIRKVSFAFLYGGGAFLVARLAAGAPLLSFVFTWRMLNLKDLILFSNSSVDW